MQRIGGEYTVQDPNGNAVPGGIVTIYAAGVGVPFAGVYAAAGVPTPTVPITNPVVADALGRWQVALPDGRYDLTFSGGSFPTYTIPNVCVFDNTITYPSPMLGTVTSVALAAPAEFTVSAAVTGSGTLTLAYGTWAGSKMIIAPVGGGGTPTLRNLVVADLPSFGPTATTTFGSATQVAQVTTDARGIITGITNVTVTPAWSDVTSKPTTIPTAGLTDAVQVAFRQTATTTLSNSTTETSVLSTGVGSTTIAANRLVAGTTLRVLITGTMGITNAQTLRLRLKVGAQTLLDTAAQVVHSTYSITAGGTFSVELVYTVRTTGAGGTGIGQIALKSQGLVNGVGVLFPLTGTTGTSAIDTTISGAVDVTAQFGTAAVANTIVAHTAQIFLEA